MNRVRWEWLAAALALLVWLGGCTPREQRFPPAVDYELLEKRVEALRRQGRLGQPQGWSAESARRWAMLQRRLALARQELRHREQVDVQAARQALGRAAQIRAARLEQARQQRLQRWRQIAAAGPQPVAPGAGGPGQSERQRELTNQWRRLQEDVRRARLRQ